MLLVWSHLLWFYFLNRADEVPGEEKWEELNMCKNFSSPHCATTLEMLKISGYCCSRWSEVLGGWGKEGLPPGFFHVSSFSGWNSQMCWVYRAKRTAFGIHTVLLQVLREQLWGDTAGEHRGDCSADPAQQPTGHRPAENQAQSAGPWTWGINHRCAPSEKRVWRRGENPLNS